MDIIFTPQECKGESPKFSGSITLKLLSTSEKFRLLSKCEFEITEDGIAKKNLKQLAALADVLDETKKYFIKIDLKRLSDGKVFNKYEDLEFDDEVTNILISASMTFLTGLKLGNAPLPT